MVSSHTALVGLRDVNTATHLIALIVFHPCSGEYYFGGIPLWMRHVADEAGNKIECFRCADPLWEREMKRWVSIVVDMLKPQLASNGGPIIWMQVENEYDPDDDYLEWAVDMARNISTEVPWSLCGHDITECNRLNGHSNGAMTSETPANKVVCTVNGFWSETGVGVSQPGPVFFDKLWSGNPTQPAAWTEDQGWFDEWGLGHRVRWTSDQLYGIARFLAFGGSYHNFYMLTGGNNYGLRAGRDTTTAYAPDTAIDNLLLRHETRFSSLRAFFAVVRSIESDLLQQSMPARPIPLNSTEDPFHDRNSTAEAHAYGKIIFLSNTADTALDSGTFQYRGEDYFLPNHTVVILDTSCNKILFNTSAASLVGSRPKRPTIPTRQLIPITNWASYQDEVGYGAVKLPPRTSPEQLNITENKSDYLWYSFYTNGVGKITVEAIGYGGYQYSYVDGVLSDTTDDFEEGNVRQLRPKEKLIGRKKVETFPIAMGLLNQPKRVDILSVAMGLTTTISPQSGKGIESVTVGNRSISHTEFATAWKLKGEEFEIYTEEGAGQVQWQQVARSFLRPTDGLLWLRGFFEIPDALLPFVGAAQPNQTALVVNLNGLNKGMAYVNGFHIGRYWLVEGDCGKGDCAPPLHGSHCFMHWEGCGKPTQHLYHIPFEVLKPSGNVLTLFEETQSSKIRNLTQVHIMVVLKHQQS
jgi:beta-galactosidase